MAEKYHANRGGNEQTKDTVKAVAKEAGSKYLEAHGVPKPLADMATKKLENNLLIDKAAEQLAKNPQIQQAAKAAEPLMNAIGGKDKNKKSDTEGEMEQENNDSEGDLGSLDTTGSSGTFHGKAILPMLLPIILIVGSLVLIIFLFITAIFPTYEMLEGIVVSHDNLYNKDKAATHFPISTITNGKVTKEEEQRFYKILENTKQKFKDEYGIEIDTDLITATLFSQYLFGDYIESDNHMGEILKEPVDVSLKKSADQVELLARYMMKTIHYKKFMGCAPQFKAEIMEDSLSDEMISKNDEPEGQMWQDKVSDEHNYENYRFWMPWRECAEGENPTVGEAHEGTGDTANAKCCDTTMPDQYVLSKRENQVYYYNLLLERFMPEYYKDFMPDYEERKKEKIEEMVDDIYLLYHTFLQSVGEDGNGVTDYYPSTGDGTMDQNSKGFFCNAVKPLDNIRITAQYGYYNPGGNQTLRHDGIDFGVAAGSNVYAIAGGTVYKSSNDCASLGGFLGNYCNNGAGNYIVIEHNYNGQKYYSTYMHLSSANVRPGQTVAKGAPIGQSGNSGNSTGAHLHLQVNVAGKGTINPNEFFTNSNFYNDNCQGG